MNEACIDILCRLCLNKSYFYSHIYVGQSTNSGPIYETINYVYELQISVDDGLPEYVCQQCLSVVHEFDKYKRNAQKAKVELIRLKQNVQENPEILRGRNLSSKELVAEITPEVQENLQIFIKEEEDDECFDAENCVFTPAKEHNEGERKILIKEEEVDISDDSFETETTSVAQRSCTESQVPFGPMIHKNEIPPFRREDSYQEPDMIAVTSERLAPSEGSARGQFGCDICSKVFRTNSCLKRHRSNHSIVKPFSCSICSKVYKRKNHLEDHLKKHTGVKPFVCSVCSKEFFRKTALIAHERVHTGVKPFQCQFCSRSFAQKGHMQHHLRSHSEERPYGCDTCGARFKYKPVLIDHVSIHAKEKSFQCHLCPKKFRLKRLLSRHLIRHEMKLQRKLAIEHERTESDVIGDSNG